MSRVRHSPSWGRSREPGHTRRIDAARRAALRGRGRDCTARDPELSAEQTAPTRRSLPGACTVPQPASAHCSERAPQQCLRPRAVLRPQSPSRVPTLHSCTGHCCSHRPVPVSSRFQSRLARCRKGREQNNCSLCVVCATLLRRLNPGLTNGEVCRRLPHIHRAQDSRWRPAYCCVERAEDPSRADGCGWAPAAGGWRSVTLRRS